VINSKGEKGCESPICLWVTRWLIIIDFLWQLCIRVSGLLPLSEYLISTVLLVYITFD
jgi:hypothetical protein